MSRHTLLLVDDEKGIRKSLSRVFVNENYDVETASSGEEGLERIKEKDISLVISDERMPGIQGVDFLSRVKSQSPDTVRILLTGYGDLGVAVRAVNEGNVYRFFTKPWNDEDLKSTIKDAIRQYEIARENREAIQISKERNRILHDLNQGLELRVKERAREVVRLNKEGERDLIDSVRVLADLIELHDSFLATHSKRVAIFSKEIAKRMDVSENEMWDIEIGGLLHDIGTIRIPSHVLKKAECEITPAEKAIIQEHPMTGQETVAKVKRLRKVGKIIRHHHETFDGNGYPDRLRGDKIPLGSRIVAVADVFDSLANRRKSDSGDALKERAISHIEKYRGLSFDPVVVDVFLEYLGCATGLRNVEAQVGLSELAPGMILSRDLRTGTGRLLLAKGTALAAVQIERVLNFHGIDPVTQRIFVYQSS
jgi:putative nucleotidyltransferase with HDIG domain